MKCLVLAHALARDILGQNAAELALPGRQRCPLGGDALKARRGGG